MLLLKNAFLDRIGAHTLLFPSYFCVSNPTPPLPSHYTSEGDEITTEKRNNTTERERERMRERERRAEETRGVNGSSNSYVHYYPVPLG